MPGYLGPPGYLSIPGYLRIPGYLSQLGEPVPDPEPVNLCQEDYPTLIEPIVLLKQCSSEPGFKSRSRSSANVETDPAKQ